MDDAQTAEQSHGAGRCAGIARASLRNHRKPHLRLTPARDQAYLYLRIESPRSPLRRLGRIRAGGGRSASWVLPSYAYCLAELGDELLGPVSETTIGFPCISKLLGLLLTERLKPTNGNGVVVGSRPRRRS